MDGNEKQGALTAWLNRAPQSAFTIYAIAAAFTTYFCMYAFRKPFSAAKYADLTFWALDLKTVFVISQIVGYTLSKYIGVKICAEVKRQKLGTAIVLMIILAEAALLLFAVLPQNLKIVAIFLNGLPLGMVWGLVVRFLEGRRTSELLLAGLSCSFILASGVVKDSGLYLMNNHGISEFWMPFLTGICYFPLFLIAVWMLNQLPDPNQNDVAERVERRTMDGKERSSFFKEFLPGLVLLFVAYFFITAFRDFRDNYGIEIFTALGYEDKPAIFTRTELPVAFGIMLVMGLLNLVRDNRHGLAAMYGVMAFGTLLLAGSTFLLQQGVIDGVWWMILIGFGSYLAYVPYGSILFDRTIAATRYTGTAVFAINLADALGYTGSIGVQIYKDVMQGGLSRFEFFVNFTYFTAILATVLQILACIYFLRKRREHETA